MTKVGSRSLLALLLMTLLQTFLGAAHTLDEAFWESKILDDGAVQATLKLPTGVISQFDKNGDGRIEDSEITDELTHVIDKLAWVDGDGVRGKLSLLAAEQEDAQVTHTIVGAVWSFSSKPEVHTFHYIYFAAFEENPKCIASFTAEDNTKTAFVFTREATAHELSQVSKGLIGFFSVGVEHILLGFDHLLFVAVLMLAGGSAVQLFKMVTAFTLAHSVTLALAVLDVFTLPSSIVEPIIVFSIVVAALENIRRDEPESRWKMAAGFGLIHGMGFAGVLADMNISGRDALVPLIGFNLGVEAGQVGVIFLALPLYYFISQQDWNRRFRITGSALAALLALYWTFERVLS